MGGALKFERSDTQTLLRGVGRVPEWWMEITPHDTLYLEEDEEWHQQELEEARMYAKLAAKDDLAQ